MRISTKFIRHLTGGIVAASLLGFLTSAYAVPTLTISDGVDPVVTIVDGGVGDANAASGAVQYNGSIGQWSLVVAVGETKPFLGSASAPQLDLGYVVTSTGSGSLTIKWSDTGFTAGAAGFVVNVGGTTDGSLAIDTYADASDALFGTGIHLTSADFSSSPFYSTASAGAVGSSPFSLTEQVVVTHGSGTLSDSANIVIATTPDGGATITLLGTALAGLGLLGIFFRRRTD